jgi:hypothetical protein
VRKTLKLSGLLCFANFISLKRLIDYGHFIYNANPFIDYGSLKHPNIVRVRGTVGRPGHDNFMIMMDCLNLTLREKIIEWDYHSKTRRNTTLNVLKRMFHIGSHRHYQPADSSKINPAVVDVHTEKLMAAYDLVRGMKFLHSNRYVLELVRVYAICLYFH